MKAEPWKTSKLRGQADRRDNKEESCKMEENPQEYIVSQVREGTRFMKEKVNNCVKCHWDFE
jgi:hypothetical protein